MRISHNMMAINNNRMLGINEKKKVSSTEKLSSGYRINRAADDAAGLAISEKMRRLIRGLDKGTENALDGVSWTQSGDGALNEVDEILHRMTELTVKALNETHTDSDRMAMELEFEQLQSELDRIGDTTTFNETKIFAKHDIPYYQCQGSAKWDPQQMHVVTAGENDLTFEYRVSEDEPAKTMSITVPSGRYTTQELIDEIESRLSEVPTDGEKIVLEFTAEGFCNANLEGGEKIDSLSGGLSYLMYDMYKGGSYGALIGTTSFLSESSRLDVVSGQNDKMSFDIENFAGGSSSKDITIRQGSYTRSELIDLLNEQLADTTVRATAYGDGIKLSSEDAIVTGFKGNMFKIDGNGTIYNSVFYDNVKYGTVSQEPAVFTGGCVLPTNSRDEEHKYYRIDSSNNTLTMAVNGSDTSVTITIPDGEYTARQMADKLNELFADAGLDVTADRRTYAGYDGIVITSNVKGPESKIDIDSASSAYQTLFVQREYNQYGSNVNPVNENRADSEGTFNGSKDLSILTSEPLTVTAGVNDSFRISLNGDPEFTITLSPGTYSSVDDVISEIDNQLNGAGAQMGYKGKLSVSKVNNKLLLTGNPGQGINTIRVSAETGRDVFDAIFQGYSITTTTPTASGTNNVVLNTPYDGNIGADESSMKITVDGKEYTVNLPTGDVSTDDIKQAIENTIPGHTEIVKNTFATEADSGDTIDRNFGYGVYGASNTVSWNGSETGKSEKMEGAVGFRVNEPAQLELGPSLQSNMVVNSANNKITLSLNGTQKVLTLDDGTYTPDSLKNALQAKIDENFGTGMGGATVSISNNKLVITSRLPDGYNGENTSISCSTTNSSFLKELNTTRTAAEWISDRAIESTINIDNTNQGFSFTYKENGNTQNINLTLSQGSYSRSSFITELNRQLGTTNTGIMASLSDGKLVLTSQAKGNDVYISYATQTGGTSAEALFGPLTETTAAEIIINLKTQDSINIESGVNDTFTINVNGTDRTVTLDEGTYNRSSFVSMLNNKLNQANAGVEAFVSGDKLGYRTTATGNAASVSMSYDGGGSSMEAIYGTSTREYSGVTVQFDAEGKLSLTTTKSGSTIRVSTTDGGAFQQPVVTKNPISTGGVDGYHSSTKSYIDGVSLSGDISIDKWNDNLNFTFKNNGTNQDVSIDVPDGTYTFSELQTKLQELIDGQVGQDTITVTVSDSGVRLEANNVGSTYQFSGFSGDFYDKVICSCQEKTSTQSVTSKDGKQTMDSTYTVGRKDVRSGGADIRQGISDELSLDLTYDNTVHTISIKLDAGHYSGEELKQEIQEKLNAQLLNMGLPENLIEVGIGGINTGVYGANDQNALNFSLSKTVAAPTEGQFIIDGVSGNAAFEIFYQTDGEMEPAYISGTKDISNGVTVPAGETDMSFKVDGVEYSITIPENDYTAEEILIALNDQFDAVGAPVIAERLGNKIKISHRILGQHEIDDVRGGLRENIFFEETGQKKSDWAKYVKLSSESGDSIGLNRHILSTASLGLNSCCISQTKNAEKALSRIEQALKLVSDIRSDFGSTQNRLEHAIRNNENKEENLQSAESVIRDTDMASEMLKYSTANIIAQAGQAMLAQANQSQQGILSLLS